MLLGKRTGAAYVLAITTLLVGVILALAMLRSAGGGFLSEDSRRRKQAAYDLAEAGVDYAYWQLHYNGAHLPYSATVSLTTGSFQVSAVDDGNRDRSTVLISSTGIVGSNSYTMRRVRLGLLPYHYACCENSSISDGDTLTSAGPGRGLRANGSIWLGSLVNSITTGAWATSTITAWGTVNPKYPNSPRIRFPDIDLSYYFSIKDYYYWYDVSFTSLSAPGSRVVIYVSSKVYIKGTYNGIFTIVATHDISVNGNLTPANPNSYLALITSKKITLEGAAQVVEAVLYAPAVGENVEIKGITTVTGSVCADDVTTDQAVTYTPDPRLNLGAMKQLRLPGL